MYRTITLVTAAVFLMTPSAATAQRFYAAQQYPNGYAALQHHNPGSLNIRGLRPGLRYDLTPAQRYRLVRREQLRRARAFAALQE